MKVRLAPLDETDQVAEAEGIVNSPDPYLSAAELSSFEDFVAWLPSLLEEISSGDPVWTNLETFQYLDGLHGWLSSEVNARSMGPDASPWATVARALAAASVYE